ncbi:MAG: family 43 glycosylhydrolase [Verrucomicrobia bacterium]|nr:family 43 glycosylhydrolase [Verrucomicrobiota bacterium]
MKRNPSARIVLLFLLAVLTVPAAGLPPGVVPAQPKSEILAGLKSHDRALYVKEGWIRDPYIVLGPDDYYYLTGTTPNPGDPREQSDPYNVGLWKTSIVGSKVQVWRSRDLATWDYVGVPFTLEDTAHFRANPASIDRDGPDQRRIWAPEIHWTGDRWALVHCPKGVASLALSAGPELKGPWTHPMGLNLGARHDPSLFKDDDGTWYLLWENTLIAPLSRDFTRFTAEAVRIDPAGTRPGPNGTAISRIGHEGATMAKVFGKYVHFGTAWSTDLPRKGSYNLYYCTAAKPTGPFGPRRFAGRFLGHGTPFQTRDGKWWCTAFFNGNVPPVPSAGIESRDLRAEAQTINQRGTTIVPLEVRQLPTGDVSIRAKDPRYASPGPDEVQQFQF